MKTSMRKAYERFGSVAVLLICALALPALLYGTQPASAHDGDHSYTKTAGQVDPADQESVKNFVLHIKAHVDLVPSGDPGAFTEFKNRASIEATDGGHWRSDTTYVIRLRKDGTITHHPYQPLAENGSLYDFEDDQATRVVEELIRLAGENEEGVCVNYVLNGNQRASCAVEFLHPAFREATSKLTEILIAGLHHDFDDVSFAKATCPYYDPQITANEVVNEETLKQFVQEFVGYWVEQRKRLGGPGVIGLRHCWRGLPWKYGSIYMFFMPENQIVAFNGNTPELENKTLNVTDDNQCNVGREIISVINDEARECRDLGLLPENSEGFVEYLWDDPTTTDDDVDIKKCPTCAPGTSPKLTYVQKVPVQITPTRKINFIFGSGIYPEEEETDGGCAIAGGTNTPKGTIFNLFLVVSMLFSAALWKQRSRKRGTMMKKGACYVCALALPVFFSGTQLASAHGGNHSSDSVTASGVMATDPVTMKNFLLHAKAHWESITDPNKNIEFEKSLTEEGDWKKDTIYLMVIDEDGTIFTHGHDPEAQNGTLRHYSGEGDARTSDLHPEVRSLIEASNMEGGDCVHYHEKHEEDHMDGDESSAGRTACAVKFTHPVWKTGLILIAGYHHGHDDDDTELSFDRIECPFFTKPIAEKPYFTQGTTANEVTDSDTLKAFVENFRDHFTEQVEKNSQSPAQLARIRNCWRIPPWKHGGIYLFIITENGLVFFNGNGPDLENRSFNVMDDNECNVGEEVIGAINGEARQCRDLGLLPEDSDGFVEYLWDNPTDSIDPVSEEGRAPGDVPKLSYVVSFSDPGFFEGERLIIGSGYHPQARDDGGCAIAGAGGTAKGGLLSLFLTVSVLLSAVFAKKAQKTGTSR